MLPKSRPAKRRKGWQPTPVIGRYETSGLPVYEGDDYVTDAEGGYLTRAEANKLLAEGYVPEPMADAYVPEPLPLVTSDKAPYCARQVSCPAGACEYPRPCDKQTLPPPNHE